MNRLTENEFNFIEMWEIEKELDQWARHLDDNPIPWKTEHEWNAHRAEHCFHPSALARYLCGIQPCKLYLWHMLMGSPGGVRLGLSGRKRADMGTAAHLMMDYYMGTRAQHHGYEYHCELKVHEPNLYIKGAVDALTYWPLRQPIIWDYKSIASTAFQRLKRPHAHYIAQVNTYMGVLKVPLCILLYVVKDSSQFFACKIHFDEALWDRTVEELNEIIELNWDHPEPQTGSYCKGCPYYYACFKE